MSEREEWTGQDKGCDESGNERKEGGKEKRERGKGEERELVVELKQDSPRWTGDRNQRREISAKKETGSGRDRQRDCFPPLL